MGFLSKAWKGIKNGFKKIGKAIKSGFQKFGKFMGRFGMLGSLAMSMILPGIGGMLLKGLGNNVFNLGLKTVAGQTGVSFSQFTNALVSKGGARAALGHTLNFGGSIVGKVTAPIKSVTEGVTTLLKTGANAVGINVFEPIAKTIGIDNYEGQYFKEGLGEAAQRGEFFGESGGFASAYKNSTDVLKTAYGPKLPAESDVQYNEEDLERFAIEPRKIPESTVTVQAPIVESSVRPIGRAALPPPGTEEYNQYLQRSADSAPPDLSLEIDSPVETPVAQRSILDRAVAGARDYFDDAVDRAQTKFKEIPGDVIDSFGESIVDTAEDAVFGKEDEVVEQAYGSPQFATGERTRVAAQNLAAADVQDIGVIQQYTGDNPYDTNTFFIQTPVHQSRLQAFSGVQNASGKLSA